MTILHIFNQTKALRPIDKAKLADMILSDLDKPDISIEKIWIKEINRRKDNLRSGKTKPLSYQQVMGRYK